MAPGKDCRDRTDPAHRGADRNEDGAPARPSGRRTAFQEGPPPAAVGAQPRVDAPMAFSRPRPRRGRRARVALGGRGAMRPECTVQHADSRADSRPMIDVLVACSPTAPRHAPAAPVAPPRRRRYRLQCRAFCRRDIGARVTRCPRQPPTDRLRSPPCPWTRRIVHSASFRRTQAGERGGSRP
jgi:hypothetical protein